MLKILLIGPQGSGKGTQAQILAEKFSLPVFSSGNMLRQRIGGTDRIGLELAALMKQGLLLPDDLVNKIVAEKIMNNGQHGYILDGYPRLISQVEFLNSLDQLTHVFEIYITDDEAVRRISGRLTCPRCQAVYHLNYNPSKINNICDHCGSTLETRADDVETTVRRRLRDYHQFTEPMIEFYRQEGIYARVNGTQSIPDVTKEILGKLGK